MQLCTSRFGEGVRRSRRQIGPRHGRYAHTFAALDLGTNNCRLLVARPLVNGSGFRVIDAFSRIVRLGERVAETGLLSSPAIERTLRALRVCSSKIERCAVTRVRGVATEACRRADNCDEFLDLVKGETGITLDVITPNEEAEIGLVGSVPLLSSDIRYALVFDIGGGSTELMFIELTTPGRPHVLDVLSLPCGVVTLSECYGGRDISPDTYEAMVNDTLTMLVPFETANGISARLQAGELQMLGTSGTVTTVAAVNLGLSKYDRSQVDSCWIGRDSIANTSHMLARMSYSDRVEHPCIKRDRADLVVAGCAILEAIMRSWPVPWVRVADRGLREGILLALMAAADLETGIGPNSSERTSADH